MGCCSGRSLGAQGLCWPTSEGLRAVSSRLYCFPGRREGSGRQSGNHQASRSGKCPWESERNWFRGLESPVPSAQLRQNNTGPGSSAWPRTNLFLFLGPPLLPPRCSSALLLPTPNPQITFLSLPQLPFQHRTQIFPLGTHQPASSDSLVQRPPPQVGGPQVSRVQIGHLTAASAVAWLPQKD